MPLKSLHLEVHGAWTPRPTPLYRTKNQDTILDVITHSAMVGLKGQGVCWDFFGSGFKSNSRFEHVCGIVWKRSRGHFFYRYNPKKCLWIFLTNQNSSLKALHKWRKHHERVSNIRVQRARTLWSNKKAVLNVSGLLGFLIHFESEPPKKTLWLFLNFSSFPLISDIC